MIGSVLKSLLRPLYRHLLTARGREIIDHYRSGQVSETDIELFRHLDGITGLVIDAGANRGQFALSMLAVNRSLRVLSFEPNPALRWSLLLIGMLYPARFRFRLRGLSTHRQSMTLHVPTTSAIDLSSNASLDACEFDKDYVRERLAGYAQRSAGQYGFSQRSVKLLPLDELGLEPVAIKIDVEGWELQALTGMQKTIVRCHPLLMIELNNRQQLLPWLRQLGYQLYGYDAHQQLLLPTETGAGLLNVIAIHPQMPADTAERIKPLLSVE